MPNSATGAVRRRRRFQSQFARFAGRRRMFAVPPRRCPIICQFGIDVDARNQIIVVVVASPLVSGDLYVVVVVIVCTVPHSMSLV